MDSNPQHNEESQQVYPQYTPMNDEIDLLDIWRVFVGQKWLILGITALCTTLSIGVALLLPREYRAEVILMPPQAETIEKLNVSIMGYGDENSDGYFFKIEPQMLYQELIENFQSNQLQRQFFNENGLGRLLSKKDDKRSEDVIFEEEFSKKLAVTGINKNKGKREFVTISLEGANPEQIADWLNSFVQLIDQKTIMAQTQAFSIKVERAKDSLLKRIQSLRATEQSRRLDTIARLEEAAVVAEKLGLIEGLDHPEIFHEQVKMDGMNLSFSLQEMPLYLRGSRALQAEMDVLKQRKGDDPFIPELRSLQEEYNFLSSVRQDVENIHAMRLDRAAVADERPIKPKRKLIVVLGFVLGFLFAVVVAFVGHMIVSTKQSSVRR